MALHLKSTGIDFADFGHGSNVSMTSELLDDYEEGTWTPNWVSWSPAPATQTAVYHKVGDTCNIWLAFHDGGTTLGGGFWNMNTGLPFGASHKGSGTIVSHTHSTFSACCYNDNDTWQIVVTNTQYGWDATFNYPVD
jgi:hypothetical protein